MGIFTKTSWNDLTLSEFQKLKTINENDSLNEHEVILQKLLILTKLSEQDVRKLKYNEVQQLNARFAFVNEEPKVGDLKDEYVINGRHYTFIKNILNAEFGRFNDLSTLIDKNTPLNVQLSCVVRSKKDYADMTEDDHKQVHEDMLQLNVVDALTLCFFLASLSVSLSTVSRFSDEKTMPEMVRKILSIAEEKLTDSRQLKKLKVVQMLWRGGISSR